MLIFVNFYSLYAILYSFTVNLICQRSHFIIGLANVLSTQTPLDRVCGVIGWDDKRD